MILIIVPYSSPFQPKLAFENARENTCVDAATVVFGSHIDASRPVLRDNGPVNGDVENDPAL
jgi:hypothetical protein